MINVAKDIAKHAAEFLRSFRNHEYETVGDGSLLFPKQKIFLRGTYSHRKNDEPWEISPNLVPTEGINYILDGVKSSHAAIPFYLAPYAGAISPTALWTASNFASTASEITSGSEGYSESTRVVWVDAAASAGAKHNNASPAVFTIVTATTLAMNGLGLLTASAKGATTGALVSATRFGSARSFVNTDVFNAKYEIDGTSS